MTDMKYEYWLARIRGISSKKKCRLHRHAGSAEGIYYIEETRLNELKFLTEKEKNTIKQARSGPDPGEEYEKMIRKGIRFYTVWSEEYPDRLREIQDCPYALYAKGSMPDQRAKKAAVIGARKCTLYGEKYAIEFARMLAECGVEIISGMARGIDGMGHRGALLAGGKTYAVLGSGVDVCYPAEHIGLYSDILSGGGGVLSEFPPGTPPLAQHFPARNRIISGMSDAVLVMEAGRKSGSLITVDMALEQGKDVYALPGPIDSALSDGCNRLIHQGAAVLISPEELAEEWGLAVPEDHAGTEMNEKKQKMLESKEELLYSCLGLYPKNVDRLVSETKLDVRSVMESLIVLQLQGKIFEISKNCYVRADRYMDRKK